MFLKVMHKKYSWKRGIKWSVIKYCKKEAAQSANA